MEARLIYMIIDIQELYKLLPRVRHVYYRNFSNELIIDIEELYNFLPRVRHVYYRNFSNEFVIPQITPVAATNVYLNEAIEHARILHQDEIARHVNRNTHFFDLKERKNQ